MGWCACISKNVDIYSDRSTRYDRSVIPFHDDLLVVIVVAAAIQVGGLIFLGWLAWKGSRELASMVAESQRLTRAVAGLVVQESDTIRTLLDRG